MLIDLCCCMLLVY